MLRVRFCSLQDYARDWTKTPVPFKVWKRTYLAPWLMIQHLVELTVLFLILFKVIFPEIRTTFLMRQMFQRTMCPDVPMKRPFARLEVVQDYVYGQFIPNLNRFMSDSFPYIYPVGTGPNYTFTVEWDNGSTTVEVDLNLSLDFFQHIKSMKILSEMNYVTLRSSLPGCTKWTVGAEILKSTGSYTFSALHVISRSSCDREFYNAHVGIKRLPQAYVTNRLATSLLFLSGSATLALIFNLVKRWHRHNNWRQSDLSYRELQLYDQIHHSIGFWHPIHLVMDIILVITSIVLLKESSNMTQFISNKTLRLFAVGCFMCCWVACRWFNFSPKTYELVMIIRASFTRLVNILVGLLPLVMAFMMIGLFLFGLVSDISRTYYRFLQLFSGLIFGDDMYGVYSYYTDGTNTYTYMSFCFVTALGILAGYIFFPAFTATISFLRENEVANKL